MSAQSSREKRLRTLEPSDLGEMLIDAVSRDDKKLAKTALKSGKAYVLQTCIRGCIECYAMYYAALAPGSLILLDAQ